jgi:hypothetical protein
MIEFTRYYGQFRGLRGNLTGLPSWARTIVGVFALPGLILLALSIVAFVVSLLALLLLTAPVYSALKSLTNRREAGVETEIMTPGVKHVDVKVVE